MKQRLLTILSGIPLALAVAVSSWIALWPSFYQGVSQTIGPSGEVPPPVRISASFLEVNGLHGGVVLAVPVLLTLLGLFNATLMKASSSAKPDLPLDDGVAAAGFLYCRWLLNRYILFPVCTHPACGGYIQPTK